MQVNVQYPDYMSWAANCKKGAELLDLPAEAQSMLNSVMGGRDYSHESNDGHPDQLATTDVQEHRISDFDDELRRMEDELGDEELREHLEQHGHVLLARRGDTMWIL